MTPLAWFIIALAGFILEMLQPGIYLIFFAIGAFVTGLFAAAITSVPAQLMGFALFSAVSIILLRSLVYGRRFDGIGTNTDRLMGKTALVTIRIPRGMHGFVKVGSEIWMATADEEIQKGETVEIVSLSGATLTVRRTRKTEENGNTEEKK